MSVPHDHDAERALLAAMLRSVEAAEYAERNVSADDFHVLAHGTIFNAICQLRAEGVRPDATLLLDKLGESVDPKVLVNVTAFEASTVSVQRYADIVVTHRTRRRLMQAGTVLIEEARSGDPNDVLDAHVTELESITLPKVDTNGLLLLDEMLDRPDEQRAPWVVHGLLRSDWRVVVVATEGAGKTLMLQQIALAASQGVHPFNGKPIRPIRTLLVDAENPDERIIDGCTPIRESLRLRNGNWEPRTWLWHRPGGLDLRSRRDVAAFEDVLYQTRPDLVCAGPSYKLAERGRGEGWDESARAVQTVFDKLRARFGFALILEDHAPQSQNGVRDLRPFGSSMWLRWPELGIKLIRAKGEHNVTVGHWRGSRLKHKWPDELHRGGAGSLPWVGKYNDGWDF